MPTAKPKVTKATAATKKPATKPVVEKSKPVAKKAAAPKTAKPAPRTTKANGSSPVSLEQRANYVEVAAYYIAERRGFAPGDPLADWTAAEAEVDRLLASGHFGA